MIGLLQRVTRASVRVDGQITGQIERGLMVLVAVQQHDTREQAKRLAERLLTYRVFADASGRMNLDVTEVGGGVLLVPQFTLAADTRKGKRPSFSTAAPPKIGQQLFGHLTQHARDRYPNISTGQFGADMRVSLCNDGPVTFWLTA